MSYKSKIRMSIGWIYPIGILTSYIFIFLELELRELFMNGGYHTGKVPLVSIILVAIMFTVLGIIQWFRYRNWIYPVFGLLMGITTAQVSFIFPDYDGNNIGRLAYFISFIVIILFVLINWHSFYSHERFEINSRRLFRLASERIFSNSNGFTERPYTGGKADVTRDELLGFARYLHSHYVVRPFYYENSVCLSFSMNKSLVVVHEGTEVSHVIIGFDGTITVKISGKDYRDYRQKLSFDKLCQSLTDIFSRFLVYYRQGLESRIMIELKSSR